LFKCGEYRSEVEHVLSMHEELDLIPRTHTHTLYLFGSTGGLTQGLTCLLVRDSTISATLPVGTQNLFRIWFTGKLAVSLTSLLEAPVTYSMRCH
jgi:hypothetical protein